MAKKTIGGVTFEVHDNSDLLTRAPSVCVYGQAKVGKTVALLQAFQRARVISPAPNAARAYASWLKGLKGKPEESKFDSFVLDNQRILKPNESPIDVIRAELKSIADWKQKGTCPFDSVCLLEYSEIGKQMHANIFKGQTGTFKHWNMLNAEHNEITTWAWGSGMPLLLEMHERQPEYFWDEEKQAFKYADGPVPGGIGAPEFPTNQGRIAVCARMDAVFHMENHGSPTTEKRMLLTQGTKYWLAGFREFCSTENKIKTMEQITPTNTLRDILLRAGYSL